MQATVAEREVEMMEGNDARLDQLGKQVGYLGGRVEEMSSRINDLGKRVEQGFTQVDARLGQVDARLGQLEGRFDSLQRTLLQLGGVVIAALLGLFGTIVGLAITQL